MEKDPANKVQAIHNLEFDQLCAEYLGKSSSALFSSLIQESITLLRDKVLRQPSSHSSVARTLAIIDQWNAGQPISHLPPELISHIVSLGFPITNYFRGGRESSPDSYMKILSSLMTISRTWRNTIIGTPSLWGLLSTSFPSQINRLSLERSRNCPLLIELDSWPRLSNMESILELALPHWNRWSHASLRFSPIERIMEHFTSSAPSLEVFYLQPDSSTILGPPINLFGGFAPTLRTLVVSKIPLLWSSEVFKGLRHLELEDIKELISAAQILALLTSSPHLESFAIHFSDIEPSFLSLPPAQTSTILPKLKSITFDHVGVEAVGNILPFIRTPNCEELWLIMFRETDGPFDAADFLDRSLGHYSALLRSILSANDLSELSFKPNEIEWACNMEQESDDRHFYISIPDIEVNSSIPWVEHLLQQGVDPDHHLSVFLCHVGAEHLTGLKRISLLPNVKGLRITLGESSPELFLDLLGGEVEQPPAFPALTVLRLENGTEWPLEDMENMLIRRYNNHEQGVPGVCSMHIVLITTSSAGLKILKSEYRTRLYNLQGVESVDMWSRSDFGKSLSVSNDDSNDDDSDDDGSDDDGSDDDDSDEDDSDDDDSYDD